MPLVPVLASLCDTLYPGRCGIVVPVRFKVSHIPMMSGLACALRTVSAKKVKDVRIELMLICQTISCLFSGSSRFPLMKSSRVVCLSGFVALNQLNLT